MPDCKAYMSVHVVVYNAYEGRFKVRQHTEKMSPVYICQNDKPMTSLALSTAHQVNTNLCQLHSLKDCHIFVINLSKTCHPQFRFFAIGGS